MNVKQLANVCLGQAQVAPELPVYMQDNDGLFMEVDMATLSALNTPDGLQSVIALHPVKIDTDETTIEEED